MLEFLTKFFCLECLSAFKAAINFVSQQKLDVYLLEILSEPGKKDKVFSVRSLMKAQKNLTNIMGPLHCFWPHLDHVKKDNEGVIDLNNILLEITEQCVILVGQCRSKGSYHGTIIRTGIICKKIPL